MSAVSCRITLKLSHFLIVLQRPDLITPTGISLMEIKFISHCFTGTLPLLIIFVKMTHQKVALSMSTIVKLCIRFSNMIWWQWISSKLFCLKLFDVFYCFVMVVGSFQWDRVPSILPMRTKSQGNEVILSTYYHSNLIRTTPLLIEFCLSKFKTKINQVKLKHHLLQDTFTVVHKTNNQWDQTCSTSTICLQQLELQ